MPPWAIGILRTFLMYAPSYRDARTHLKEWKTKYFPHRRIAENPSCHPVDYFSLEIILRGFIDFYWESKKNFYWCTLKASLIRSFWLVSIPGLILKRNRKKEADEIFRGMKAKEGRGRGDDFLNCQKSTFAPLL